MPHALSAEQECIWPLAAFVSGTTYALEQTRVTYQRTLFLAWLPRTRSSAENDSHSRQLRHSDWNLSREETWSYLESNELGFGEHGALVPKTGKLNEGLMERFLLPTLPNQSTDLSAPPSPPSHISSLSDVRSSNTIAPSDLVSQQHTVDDGQRLQGPRLRNVAHPQKGSVSKKRPNKLSACALTKHRTRCRPLIRDLNGKVTQKVTSVTQRSPVSSSGTLTNLLRGMELQMTCVELWHV